MKAIFLCSATPAAGTLDCLNEEMAQEPLPDSLPAARDECLLSYYVQFRHHPPISVYIREFKWTSTYHKAVKLSIISIKI